MIWYVVIFLVLLAVSAFFSSLETAYTSLSPHQLHDMADKGGRRGRRVKQLTDNPSVLLTTILIGNDLANVGAAAVVTLMTARLFGTAAVSLASGVLTLIILIFCEVTPKRIAIAHNESMAKATAFLLFLMSIALRPFILLVTWVSSLITRFFIGKEQRDLSLDNILSMIKAGENTGIVSSYEGRMAKSVFRLDDIPAQTVMTPRTDVFSLEMSRLVSDVVDEVVAQNFSRIPVYEIEPEKIVGIILAKDVLKAVVSNQSAREVKDIMRPPLFAPETQKLDRLFSRFQAARIEMGMILDEYGGFAGIVTLEDIAEEIFGDFHDESDKDLSESITKIGEKRYRIAADVSLPMIHDELGIDLPEGRPDQILGAYVLDRLEHLPFPGESFSAGEWRIEVEDIEKRRIISVVVESIEKKG